LAVDPHGLNQAEYLERMKEYRKEVRNMEADRAKLYALILQYLSDESDEEIKRSANWLNIEANTDHGLLWTEIEKTHNVNTISKVTSVVKLTARNDYHQMRQGQFESIIAYKQRFNNALQAYQHQTNPTMDDVDIAMDFFRGLDNARFAEFKTEILNGLTSKALTTLNKLNEMFQLANQWVKSVT
jgi:hypothetical protein